jgi:hypothetical protein
MQERPSVSQSRLVLEKQNVGRKRAEKLNSPRILEQEEQS